MMGAARKLPPEQAAAHAPLIERANVHGVEELGLMTSNAWALDPKRLAFTAARYKFVAKMLEGRRSVLEIGCADAFFSRIVQQAVGEFVAIDFDPAFVADANRRMTDEWPFACVRHDLITDGPIQRPCFDACFALDVLEHVQPADEEEFLRNAVASLGSGGVAIFGTPSLASQHLASPLSRAGHVNCQDGPQLKATLQRHFRSVFMFSMNDEVVHTGHHAMAHYLLALCAERR